MGFQLVSVVCLHHLKHTNKSVDHNSQYMYASTIGSFVSFRDILMHHKLNMWYHLARQKVDHHNVPYRVVRIWRKQCANNSANMACFSTKTHYFLSQLPTLAAPTFKKLKVECTHIVGGSTQKKTYQQTVAKAASKNRLLQTLDTSSCIAKLEVLLGRKGDDYGSLVWLIASALQHKIFTSYPLSDRQLKRQ